jgi:hypothetical protein
MNNNSKKELIMFIKLIFKREPWNTPGSPDVLVDRLFAEPAILDELPADAEADQCAPVRSLLNAQNPDVFSFYLDCGDASRENVEKAVQLFARHYKSKAEGLPVVQSTPAGAENEIIANMRVALENAVRKPDERGQFLRTSGMNSIDDLVRVFNV